MRYEPPNGPHVIGQFTMQGQGVVMAMRVGHVPVRLRLVWRPDENERWCVVQVLNNLNRYYFGATGRGWKNLRDVRRVFDQVDNMLRVRGVCIELRTEIQI